MSTPSDTPSPSGPHFWRKRYAIPAEHGLWTWWSGPLLIGIAAARCPGWDSVLLLVAAVGSFFLHQPAAIATKSLAGRRPRSDLGPALGWVGVHGAITLFAVGALVWVGHTRFLGLTAVGVPFFVFHLTLIYRKSERRQMVVEMIGAGVLALWAPAAYWVGGGAHYPEPWILWLLAWSQTMAAIANVYLRLDQRRWPGVPSLRARILAGRTTLAHHAVGLALAIVFSAAGLAPWLTVVAFGIVFVDAIDSTRSPMIGARPRSIGLRQLAGTVAFVGVMVVAYLTR